MSKFAKKAKTETTETPSPAKKEKTWTNDPTLQEGGKTTEKGKAARKAKGLSVVPEAAAEKVPGFAKGAKKSSTPKAGAVKAAPAAKSSRLSDDAKIKVLTKKNPYRPGTVAEATFELIKGSKTVGEVREKAKAATGVTYDLSYLPYAARQGHISFS